MRVLVTGAAGFIGSHLCEALLAEGHGVIGLDAFVGFYPRAVKERNIAAFRGHPDFRFAELDLRRDGLSAAVADADAVVHAAAQAGLRQSWSDFESYLGCNVTGTQRLLEACRGLPIRRFLQVSTSSVYGEDAVGDEEMPLRPVSPYGITKLAAEHLAIAYAREFSLPVAVLRYFSIYGPRQRPDMAYSIFIERLLEGAPVTVFGDGEQSRSNTYIDDCVRGTLQALEGARTGEEYNIGGGETITVNAAITLIAAELGRTPKIQHEPAPPGDQRHTRADTAKAKRAFGYAPAVTPAEGLRRQIAWQRALRG